MDAATLILIAPSSLLLGAALQILVARLCSARTKGILAFLTCLPALFAVIGLAPAVRGGQSIDLRPLPWDGPLAFVLHVNALSVLFAFMGACIGGLVLLYSIGYMAHDKSATRFYAIMSIFIGGFITLVYSANLFIFYLCWEVVGLCSFSLVGFWYTNREAVNGARKVLLMTHIAGYGLLAAIVVLYRHAGTALWTDPSGGAQLYGRSFRVDAGGADSQERAGSAAYLDSRSHGRADSGERIAARRLLRNVRRLSRGAFQFTRAPKARWAKMASFCAASLPSTSIAGLASA